MNLEALVVSHSFVAIAAVLATVGWLRRLGGWVTQFEHSVGKDIAVIKHTLGLTPTLLPHPAAVTHPPAAVPAAGGGSLTSPTQGSVAGQPTPNAPTAPTAVAFGGIF